MEPASSREGAAPSGLLSRHGLMAPGVWLMRRLSFRDKMAVTVIAFLVPLIAAGYHYVGKLEVESDAAAHERVGVRYLQVLNGIANEVLYAGLGARGPGVGDVASGDRAVAALRALHESAGARLSLRAEGAALLGVSFVGAPARSARFLRRLGWVFSMHSTRCTGVCSTSPGSHSTRVSTAPT